MLEGFQKISFSIRNFYKKTSYQNARYIISRYASTDGNDSTTNKEIGKTKSDKNKLQLDDIALKNTRNFSIIAHVDHGKSTLADRLLEITGTLTIGSGNQQVLDRLQVERERGITVKAVTVSLLYNYKGEEYLLNLIDTPGHVDFSNEVARSLAACQGVILLVDANQGVQAQTVANYYLAFTNELIIIPVLNKVDLKNADPKAVTTQLENLFGIDPKEVLKISAKLGTGIEDVLQAIIERIPPPQSDRAATLRALLFDSWYNRYRGAVSLIYLKDGTIRVGDEIVSTYTKREYTVKSVGVLRPQEEPTDVLVAGQVGYITCNMRTTKEAHIGDTLYLKEHPVEPLHGFAPALPMVFAGVYPMDQSQHQVLRSAIEKLTLNDSAVTVQSDASPALGQGWRLGFLGLLHLEVFNQRLDQEYDAQAIMTAPSVPYKVKITGKKNIVKYGGEEIMISNPVKLPDPSIVAEMYEPTVIGTIISPDTYIGSIISLCMEKRGIQQSSCNIDNSRVMLKWIFPLNEVIVDFHDQLKSISSGFASFDYEDNGYVSSNLVKLNILLNNIVVEELSTIVHVTKATTIGKRMCTKLLDIIPRQMFQVMLPNNPYFHHLSELRNKVAIQASVNGKIVARENLKAFRKDVTAKLYGGDVTRRMKLLRNQMVGKQRMKVVANIELPRETFINVLKR